MICGPSGVGKSLFLHIYKKICQEKHGTDCCIETVNSLAALWTPASIYEVHIVRTADSHRLRGLHGFFSLCDGSRRYCTLTPARTGNASVKSALSA